MSADFTPRHATASRCRVACSILLLAASPLLRAADDSVIAAVYSKVANDYVRERMPDGTPKPETYALGEGGLLMSPSKDETIDSVTFDSIAKILGPALAHQHYVASKETARTDLLIMVYWGTTSGTAGSTIASTGFRSAQLINNLTSGPMAPPPPPPPPPAGPRGGTMIADDRTAELAVAAANLSAFNNSIAMIQMQNGQRERADNETARLLGYTSELVRLEDHANTPLRHLRQDVIEEVEESRYFIILYAYDFQLMWKEHQARPRWVTRFSIRERGNSFRDQVSSMVQYAARYFGEDSLGLVRKPLREGKVDFGDLRVVEEDVPTEK